MLVIFQIPLLKAIKSTMNLRQLLIHLIIMSLMLVLLSPHMSTDVGPSMSHVTDVGPSIPSDISHVNGSI